MKFEAIDGCPVPEQLANTLRLILGAADAHLNSAYRGSDPNGVAILRRFGKKSQAELYNGWLRRIPGYNPANPPGRSTHELRNDGVAYRGPAGMPLRWWQCGLDVTNPGGVVQEAARHGFTASVTYPGSPHEGHHVNLRKAPSTRSVVLRRGDRGPFVVLLTRRLAYVPRPGGGDRRYLTHAQMTYDATVEKAVRAYQRDHSQKDDGVAGPQTNRQLAASVRYWKKRRK